MAGLGWQELVIVLVIIMIIFGAGKLPEIAKSLGQGVKEFREEAQAPVVPAQTSTLSGAPGASSGYASDAREKLDDAVDAVHADADRAEATIRSDASRAEAAARDAI